MTVQLSTHAMNSLALVIVGDGEKKDRRKGKDRATRDATRKELKSQAAEVKAGSREKRKMKQQRIGQKI